MALTEIEIKTLKDLLAKGDYIRFFNPHCAVPGCGTYVADGAVEWPDGTITYLCDKHSKDFLAEVAFPGCLIKRA